MELYEKWMEAYQMLADQKGKVLLPIRERRYFSFIKGLFLLLLSRVNSFVSNTCKTLSTSRSKVDEISKETKRTKISSDHNNV